jgi:hypothetical protein
MKTLSSDRRDTKCFHLHVLEKVHCMRGVATVSCLIWSFVFNIFSSNKSNGFNSPISSRGPALVLEHFILYHKFEC